MNPDKSIRTFPQHLMWPICFFAPLWAPGGSEGSGARGPWTFHLGGCAQREIRRRREGWMTTDWLEHVEPPITCTVGFMFFWVDLFFYWLIWLGFWIFLALYLQRLPSKLCRLLALQRLLHQWRARSVPGSVPATWWNLEVQNWDLGIR